MSTNAAPGGLHLTLGSVTVGAGGSASSFSFAGAGDTASTMSIDALAIGTNTAGGSTDTVTLRGGTTTLTSSGSGIVLEARPGLSPGSEDWRSTAACWTCRTGGIQSAAAGVSTSTLNVADGTLNLHGFSIRLAIGRVHNTALRSRGHYQLRQHLRTRSPAEEPQRCRWPWASRHAATRWRRGTIHADNIALSFSSGTLNLVQRLGRQHAERCGSSSLANSVLNLEVSGAAADSVNISATGGLALAGTNVINLSSFGTAVTAGNRHLLTYAGPAFWKRGPVFSWAHYPRRPGFLFTCRQRQRPGFGRQHS